MNTSTTNTRPPCDHLNGIYVTAHFWIFKKLYFACVDCWRVLDQKQINEMKWKATMTKPLKTSDHYGCDHPDCDGIDSGSQGETYGTGV